jgi:hypothetical protein
MKISGINQDLFSMISIVDLSEVWWTYDCAVTYLFLAVINDILKLCFQPEILTFKIILTFRFRQEIQSPV